MPDAMVSRCLVDAFAMDDTLLDGRAHPLALLDWSKFQPKHRDERCCYLCNIFKVGVIFEGNGGGDCTLLTKVNECTTYYTAPSTRRC